MKGKQRIIGYEGRRRDSVSASWGAAAIEDGDFIVNGMTLTRRHYDEKERADFLAGPLTPVEPPIEISLGKNDRPVVLGIERREFDVLTAPRPTKGELMTSSEDGDTLFFVFDELPSFESYADRFAKHVATTLLAPNASRDDARTHAMLNLVSAITPHHYAINALNAFYANDASPDVRRLIWRTLVQPENRLEEFDLILDALESDPLANMQLKYKGGIADGGGVDVTDLRKVASSLAAAHEALAPLVRKLYPFLPEAHPSRVESMKAASATFEFRAAVEGESLGEKVARYIELKLLERALAGTLSHAETKPKLSQAITELAHPDVNRPTTVQIAVMSKAPVPAPQFVDIEASPPVDEAEGDYAGERFSNPFWLLGYQSGVFDANRRLELSIFPGLFLRVSAERGIEADEPPNDEVVIMSTTHDYLFQPALFEVMREHEGHRRARYHLRKARLLHQAKQDLTAFPSSVAKHAFVLAETTVQLKAGVLHTGFGEVSNVRGGNSTTAEEWLEDFAALCRAQELSDLRVTRLAPFVLRPTPETAFLDALLSLTNANQPTGEGDVLRRFRADYGNLAFNIERIMMRNSGYAVFTQGRYELTTEGQRLARAFATIKRRWK